MVYPRQLGPAIFLLVRPFPIHKSSLSSICSCFQRKKYLYDLVYGISENHKPPSPINQSIFRFRYDRGHLSVSIHQGLVTLLWREFDERGVRLARGIKVQVDIGHGNQALGQKISTHVDGVRLGEFFEGRENNMQLAALSMTYSSV